MERQKQPDDSYDDRFIEEKVCDFFEHSARTLGKGLYCATYPISAPVRFIGRKLEDFLAQIFGYDPKDF